MGELTTVHLIPSPFAALRAGSAKDLLIEVLSLLRSSKLGGKVPFGCAQGRLSRSLP